MGYGIRVKDASENVLTITPDIINISSGGRVSAPAELNGDNTYGTDIDLPGTENYPEADIGVLAYSFITNFEFHVVSAEGGAGEYIMSFCLDNNYNYYTRNEANGVMSSFTPGDRSNNNKYDSIVSLYPIAFWDKMSAEQFTAVRLFAASSYMIYDYSDYADSFINIVREAETSHDYTGGGTGALGIDDNYNTAHLVEQSSGDYTINAVITSEHTFDGAYDIKQIDYKFYAYAYGYTDGWTEVDVDWKIEWYNGSSWVLVTSGGPSSDPTLLSYVDHAQRGGGGSSQVEGASGHILLPVDIVSCEKIKATVHAYSYSSGSGGGSTSLSIKVYIYEIAAYTADEEINPYKTVYTIGSQGVENIDYLVSLRHYKE